MYKSLKTAGPRGAIINLRRVSLLQEMQDSIIRRLNVLIARLDDDNDTGDNGDEEFLTPSKSFLISMTDKLSLLHDYQKISLHLIESRLSNEIESLRSNGEAVELNEEVVARFELTLKTLESTKNDFETLLEQCNSELQQHNIKLAAKNSLIENLISKDRDRRNAIEALEKELEILKGLSEYQSINMGVMARFKECANLEQQLKEKEMVIKRLNDVIEEYRYENQ
jgi:cell division protein FtsB